MMTIRFERRDSLKMMEAFAWAKCNLKPFHNDKNKHHIVILPQVFL